MQQPTSQPPSGPPPTQRTRKGHMIPVPKGEDLMNAFRKIVQPVKKPR